MFTVENVVNMNKQIRGNTPIPMTRLFFLFCLVFANIFVYFLPSFPDVSTLYTYEQIHTRIRSISHWAHGLALPYDMSFENEGLPPTVPTLFTWDLL